MLGPLMNTSKISRNTSKGRVFVGLSGGVDSAVSAALLMEQGYDVTGVFIKVWQPDFLPCTWRDERRDAMRVAAKLNIPFLFFDFEDEYKKGVADYMIEEYRKGKTPNPDVMCNREVKFGAFWDKAKAMGADYIATGHYARNIDNELYEGVDKEKDQSYFLWTLTKSDLEHVLFPIGHLKKDEVRKIAKKYGLHTAEKKDSQGICFIGDVDIEEFLSHYIETKPGSVLDTKGNIIGSHTGALYYTLGERHGFDINEKSSDSKPYYVVSKNIKENTITVSNNDEDILKSKSGEVSVERQNLVSNNLPTNVEARIRYRQSRFKISLEKNTVKFLEPQTVDSGQSIVFYSGERCLGGAIIA